MVWTGFGIAQEQLLTFDSDIDGLADRELGLDEHTAQVRSLVHSFLHITELECTILIYHLPMVVWQQHAIFVPLDGVVWVADDVAVDVRVPAGDGSEVLHGAYVSRTWKRKKLD